MRFWLIGFHSLTLVTAGAAQSVTIPGAAPQVVVERLQARLPEGFVLRSSDDKSALFVLNRGMVAQQRNGDLRGMMVPVVIELRIRFKEKKDGLFVTASEELVGDAGGSMEFRKPVTSQTERATLQTLLNAVRDDLRKQAAPADSAP